MAEVGPGDPFTTGHPGNPAAGCLLSTLWEAWLRIRWKLTPLRPLFVPTAFQECFGVLSASGPGREVQGRMAEPDSHTQLAT